MAWGWGRGREEGRKEWRRGGREGGAEGGRREGRGRGGDGRRAYGVNEPRGDVEEGLKTEIRRKDKKEEIVIQ